MLRSGHGAKGQGSPKLQAAGLPADAALGSGLGRTEPRPGAVAWGGFMFFATLSVALAFVGKPIFATAMLVLGTLWALRDLLINWVAGITLLLLVLQFVPSRVYRLTVGAAFDLDPYRLCLLALLVAWMASSFAQGRFALRATYLDAGMALFVAAIALSYVMNPSLLASAEEIKTMIKNLAFVLSFPLTLYLIVSTIRGRRDAIVLIDVCILFAAVAGLFGLAERVTHYNVFFHLTNFVPMLEYNIPPERLLQGDFRAGLRTLGPTAHPIAFATMLSMLLPLGVARTLYGKSRAARIRSGLCAGCIGIGVFMALSRTGVIGLIVVGLVLLLGLPEHRRLIAVAGLALVGVVHAAFPGVVSTLLQFLSPSFVLSQEVGNDNGRLADYARSMTHIVNRPLFGGGFNNFGPEQFGFIDNQYLKFLLEIGLFGIAAFAFLMWRAVSVPFVVGRRLGGEVGAVLVGLSAAAAVFAVTSATFDTFGFPQVVYLFFALAGLGAVIMDDSNCVERRG
jgi:polysaccharide biosynthesis protein PslJ